jgi:hypothetical protein
VNDSFEVSITGIYCGSGIVHANKAILVVTGASNVKIDLAHSVAIVGAYLITRQSSRS